MTNVELARRVGISAPPCLRRVRALEQAGYIKGYRALLDEKRLGYEVTVFAMVHLSSQADAELTAAPHVRNVKTSLTLRNSKAAAMVPMDLPAPGGELPHAVGD